MEGKGSTGGEGTEEEGHHAGLDWEGLLRSYQEGLPIPADRQLLEQAWGKPLLTQLPWEDVLFDTLLPCLQVNLAQMVVYNGLGNLQTISPSVFPAQGLVSSLQHMQVLQQDGK